MMRRALFSAALAVLCALAAGAAEPGRKVVVIGFDGADPRLVRQYMAEGRMPHFEALSKEGRFSDLEVTNPPQTPVSWGTFITGWNPGRNHVFDFLVRSPEDYKPHFALMEEGSRPLLWGRWNRWIVPPAALLILSALAWGAWRLLGRRLGRRGWAAVLLAAAGLSAALFFAMSRYLPDRVPEPINHLKGTPFWETAAKADKTCLVFRVPDTFPAVPYPDGRLLSGLGVPDVRGRVGTPYLFTDDPAITAGDNEFSVDLVSLGYGEARPLTTAVVGPFNKPFYEYVIDDAGGCATDPEVRDEMRKRAREKLEQGGVKPTIDVPLSLDWDEAKGTCTFELQGQEGTLKVGQWSEWVVFTFEFNRFVKIQGMGRFYLLQASPYLRLYLSPIHFHPHDHGIPISYPRDYAEKLLKRFGYYKTMGWAIDTWTISSGLADEQQFLTDVYNTEDAFETMMKALLRDRDWDLYVQVYEFTDRVAHILWQYMDPGHPLYDAQKAPKYQQAMREAYERMDRIVGEARAALPEGATLIVVSDHGFASFRRAVNYNRWLVDNGYLALKSDTGILTLEDLFDDNRLLFKNVDWSRTKAYALGLGNVYVNLKGRERDGIVEPGQEYDALLGELKESMPKMVDPETGERPVHAAYTRDELYVKYDPDLTPDLRVTNTPNYRVSWQTSLGGVPEKLVESNDKAWSGDHCSLDPSFVPGLLLSNRMFKDDPRMIDVAPTILDALGVAVPTDLEGAPLWEGAK